jgi:hypothetical protein
MNEDELTPLRKAELELGEIARKALHPTARKGNPLAKFGVARRHPTDMVQRQLLGRKSSKSERICKLREANSHHSPSDDA